MLSSKGYGEAGRMYAIFTRELGLVYASAQGVRKMSSKLRFVLQDFAYINVDLVQGKDYWRITTASKTNQLEEIVKKPEALKIFKNIANLLRRLLAGVEKNESLFAALLDGLFQLESAKIEKLEDIETNIVLMVLDKLGYIKSAKVKNRAEAIIIINQALRETHL